MLATKCRQLYSQTEGLTTTDLYLEVRKNNKTCTLNVESSSYCSFVFQHLVLSEMALHQLVTQSQPKHNGNKVAQNQVLDTFLPVQPCAVHICLFYIKWRKGVCAKWHQAYARFRKLRLNIIQVTVHKNEFQPYYLCDEVHLSSLKHCHNKHGSLIAIFQYFLSKEYRTNVTELPELHGAHLRDGVSLRVTRNYSSSS